MHDLLFLRDIDRATTARERRSAMEVALREGWESRTVPGRRRGWQQFVVFLNLVQEHVAVEFALFRDGHEVASVRVVPCTGPEIVGGLRPGHFSLGLAGGRVVWEGDLLAAHLLWTEAFRGENLSLAADTEGPPRRHSWRESLLGGEVVLSAYPGVASGSVGIEVTRF